MKLTKQIYGVALAALSAGMLASCSNELNDRNYDSENSIEGIKLVRTPEVYAWSGDQTLSSTRSDVYTVKNPVKALSTRAERAFNENFENVSIDETTIQINSEKVRSYNLSFEDEQQFIHNYFSENSTVDVGLNKDFLFYAEEETKFNFFAVLGGSSIPHDVGIFFYDEEGNLKKSPLLWTGLAISDDNYAPSDRSIYHPYQSWDENPEEYYIGYEVTIPAGCKFGFYWNGTPWLKGSTTGCVIREDHYIVCSSYLLNPLSEIHPNYSTEPYNGDTQIYAATLYRYNDENKSEGKTYIGFEDAVDFDYQDLVLVSDKIIKTVAANNTEWGKDDEGKGPEETTPGCPNAGKPGYDPEGCGHVHSDPSHCETCEEGEGCNKTPEVVEPKDPENDPEDDIYHHNSEVEVNFEAVDSHENLDIEDLATKLSIHVRHATDVDIMIPVPGKYLIDSDDLYIFNEHYGVGEGYHGTYGGKYIEGSKQELIYTLGDNNEYTVKLYVEVVVDSDLEAPFNEGYIHVWTEGIDQPGLIDWCFEHNGDGINFEIWTYYSAETANTKEHRQELKGYFDQSTIEFLDSDPDYYINAFGWDYVDGTWGQTHLDVINPDDCYVTPVDSEPYSPKEDYEEGTKWDEHLNGTPYNYIWVKTGVTPDHAHGGN